MTDQQKEAYIADFEHLEAIRLEFDKIEKNEVLRFVAKLLLNSIWLVAILFFKPKLSNYIIINSQGKIRTAP